MSTAPIVTPFVGTKSQQQVAASRAIPAITGAPLPAPTGFTVIQYSKFLLAISQDYPMAVTGDFIFLQVWSTSADVQISIGQPGKAFFPVKVGCTKIKIKDGFNGLQLKGSITAQVTVEIWTGYGDFEIPDGVKFLGANQNNLVSTGNPLPVQIIGPGAVLGSAPTYKEGSRAVAAINVPEALLVGADQADWIDIKAKLTNTGNVRYGFNAADGTQKMELLPGEWRRINAPVGKVLLYSGIFIDVDVAGEGVDYFGAL